MPTVLRDGPYRFFWYSADRAEPPHIHVERDERTAKIWLQTLLVARNNGFTKRDLNRIREIAMINQRDLLTRWQREFGG